MPLFFQQNINAFSSFGVWIIEEEESFFLDIVTPQTEISNLNKRKQHLAGRFLLKHLHPSFPMECIKIADTRKPYLEKDPIHFSISHSGNIAAAIVSTAQKVGIDVEIFTNRVLKIIPKFLTQQEQELLLPFGHPSCKMETLLWSVKETVYKWHGTGLLDFKKHIQISTIQQQTDTEFSISVCLMGTPLLVHGKYFDTFCLTWVIA